MTTAPAFSYRDLTVDFATRRGLMRAVSGVSFDVAAGEIVGVVGESGSGKSVTCLAAMGLLDAHAEVGGQIVYRGEDLLAKSATELARLRGRRLGMVFQDPGTSLNPFLTVATQMIEVVRRHERPRPSRSEARRRCIEMLVRCGLPAPDDVMRSAPHELSGGQRQRVMIASALLLEPDVLFADEPTTALDVTTQARVVRLLVDLVREQKTALVFVTHDLALVGGIADRVCVMESGEVREIGTATDVLTAPRHECTRALLAARPCLDEPERVVLVSDVDADKVREDDDDAPASLFTVRNLGVVYGHGRRALHAVRDVSFDVRPGETVALVGESGSGKSTCLRAVAGLERNVVGDVRFADADFLAIPESVRRPLRSRLQFVFQDPYASLNPRLTTARIVEEPVRTHGDDSKPGRMARVREALREVGLEASSAERYPHAFSGGQRQRIAIARAIVLRPDLVLLDEPVSALDVSVQARVLDLLRRLQDEHDLAYLFVSHDIAVVRTIATRTAVLYRGEVMEWGATKRLFDDPRHPYTKALRDAVPVADPVRQRTRIRDGGELAGEPGRGVVAEGCAFADRCPVVEDRCRTVRPPRRIKDGRDVACHLVV